MVLWRWQSHGGYVQILRGGSEWAVDGATLWKEPNAVLDGFLGSFVQFNHSVNPNNRAMNFTFRYAPVYYDGAIYALGEGQVVGAGQPLVYLKSRRLRQIEVDAAKRQIAESETARAAGLRLADAHLRAADLAIQKARLQRLDLASLQQRIALLQDTASLARAEHARLSSLRQRALASGRTDQLVTEQQVERQRLAAQQAEVELSAARAELDKLKQACDLAEQAAQAEREAAVAEREQVMASTPVESLQLKLQAAQAQLAQSELVAPTRGTVLRVLLGPGESIGAKPVLQMGNLDEMVAVAEVYETDVKRVALGQEATVRSEAFPPPYDQRGLKGQIVRIGQIVSSAELKSLDPFAKADRHVVPVVVRLDAEGTRQAARFVNLQVEIRFSPPAVRAPKP